MSMTDQEKLDLYRQAISQLCLESGGILFLKAPPDDLLIQGGTLMNRPTEDGGIEFQYIMDGYPT